jgi:hypothetical protein
MTQEFQRHWAQDLTGKALAADEYSHHCCETSKSSWQNILPVVKAAKSQRTSKCSRKIPRTALDGLLIIEKLKTAKRIRKRSSDLLIDDSMRRVKTPQVQRTLSRQFDHLSLKLLKYLQLSQEDDEQEEEEEEIKEAGLIKENKDEKEIRVKTDKVEKTKRRTRNRKTSPLSCTMSDVVVSSSAVLLQRQPAMRALAKRVKNESKGALRNGNKAAAAVRKELNSDREIKVEMMEKNAATINTRLRFLNWLSTRAKKTSNNDKTNLEQVTTGRQDGDFD